MPLASGDQPLVLLATTGQLGPEVVVFHDDRDEWTVLWAEMGLGVTQRAGLAWL